MVGETTQDLLDVIIVGAGFAGLGLAWHLKKQENLSFTVLERASEVGGTWRDNTYPGAACDVPSHLYSFSFAPNPNWTHHFARQGEILEYMRDFAKSAGLLPHIQFGASVESLHFRLATGDWEVKLETGKVLFARAVVAGTGPLNKIKFPDIPGRETFQGKVMHTGHWDHAVELSGKKVAIIGTGASAIQVIPEVGKVAGKLTVFQRTPAWVIPRHDFPYSESKRQDYSSHPDKMRRHRKRIYLKNESQAVGFILAPFVMRIGALMGLKNLKSVTDPELREKLRPRYRMGCKRILLSNTYYPTFNRPNVELVTDSIAGMEVGGIKDATGKLHEFEVIIFATGFTASEHQAPFPTFGKSGQNLQDLWQTGGEAYFGTTVHGFPNLFTLIGPNTGLGHNSMIYMMECQYPYLLGALQVIKNNPKKSLEVKEEVQQKYNHWLQKRLKRTVWQRGGCESWYLNKSGKNTTLWPGFTFGFRRRLQNFDPENYQLLPHQT